MRQALKATLFTILEADMTASSLRATRQLVTGLIGRELRREERPAIWGRRRSCSPRWLTAASWAA